MKLLLAMLLTIVLRAATADYTQTVRVFSPIQDCGNQALCQPFDFAIFQFDPALGTLDAVSWSISVYQDFYGGYDDMQSPPGLTYSDTEGEYAPLLGLDASNTQDKIRQV